MNAFDLTVGGKDLSTSAGSLLIQCVESFEYATQLDLLDTLVVRFALVSAIHRKAAIDLIKPGAEFTVGIGTTTWTGDVTCVTIETAPGAPMTLQLQGLEPLHRLRNVRVSKIEEQTIDKVVQGLVSPSGVSATVEAVKATAEETVLMDEQVLTLVKRFADERNFTVNFDGTGLTFGPRAAASAAALTLTWPSDLLEASVTTDITEVATTVKMFGRDYRKDPMLLGPQEATGTHLRKLSGTVTGVDQRKKLGEAILVLDKQFAVQNLKELEELAVGELQRRADTFLRGRLVATGFVLAKTLQKVSVTGAPWPLTGPFLVAGATWSWTPGRGMVTSIDVYSDSYPPAS